jgi:hypothetical protein
LPLKLGVTMKLIIDLIPTKHNMPEDLYQSKKIVSGLRMNYEKIEPAKKRLMPTRRYIYIS